MVRHDLNGRPQVTATNGSAFGAGREHHADYFASTPLEFSPPTKAKHRFRLSGCG